MLRRIVLALITALLAVAPLAARAGDTVINVRVDERPADRKGGIAVIRNGATFVDVVDITKVFSGLLLFGKNTVRINIGGASANFVVGRRKAMIRGKYVTLPLAPFNRKGDIYVPLKVIVDLAGGVLRVNTHKRLAYITTASNLNRPIALSTPTLSPLNALSLGTSAKTAGDGLHVSLTVTNVSAAPYTLNFPNGARAAFVVSKDGGDVWDSSTAMRYTESKSAEVLAPGESRTYSAVWAGFSASGAGRYLLRAKLLSTTPVSASPRSIGVVAPAPAAS